MPNEPVRVLVVHGTARTADTAQASLRLWGFDPVLTDDPERATWIAAELRPLAVVLELEIEGFDVLDVASAFRGHPRTRDLAIVALAERATADAVAYAKLRGCDSVLGSPCDGDALAAEVERLLAKRSDGHRAA